MKIHLVYERFFRQLYWPYIFGHISFRFYYEVGEKWIISCLNKRFWTKEIWPKNRVFRIWPNRNWPNLKWPNFERSNRQGPSEPSLAHARSGSLAHACSGSLDPSPIWPRPTSSSAPTTRSTLFEIVPFHSACSFSIYLTILCIFRPNSAIRGIRPFRHITDSVIRPIGVWPIIFGYYYYNHENLVFE